MVRLALRMTMRDWRAGELRLLLVDGRAAFRQRHVGFVFQSFQLLPHLNALENVMLPLELRGERDVRERAVRMLECVGLVACFLLPSCDGRVHEGKPRRALGQA
jgi:ABC-type ATPase involved in cell division